MPRTLSDEDIQSFRARLCDVATRRFADHGYDGVTLRGLAADLGCSPMTPYRYFANKEEIFDAVRVAAFGRLSERSRELIARYPNPVERVRALAHSYLRFAREEPHAYRIMFQVDRPDVAGSAGLDTLAAQQSSGWEVVREAMAEAVAKGQLVGDPDTLAHIAWVTLHGLVMLHLADRLRLGRELDDIAEAAVDNLHRGASVGAPHPSLAPPRDAVPEDSPRPGDPE